MSKFTIPKSKLEELIIRSGKRTGLKVHISLAEHLDAKSLRHLRTVSYVLKQFVDRMGKYAFPQVYIRAPLRTNETTQGLDNVAALCRNLTINVSLPGDAVPEPTPTESEILSPSKKGKRRSTAMRGLKAVKKFMDSSIDLILPPIPTENPSSKSETGLQHPDALEMDFRVWEHIIAQFTKLQTLTLHVPNADPLWPGRGPLEETLLLLRISLERTRPRHLRTLTLSPIHAMGIIHLRWASFGAFLEVPTPTTWQNLTTLNLGITNPLPSIDSQKSQMFLGILHDYLRSFSQTLQTLKFVWLGETEGPSPMALEDETGLMERPPIHWPKLEKFWFGNISFPNKTTSLLPEVAPRCKEVKALRSTHRFSRVDGGGGEQGGEGWYTVPMERIMARRNVASLAASSIYSQQGGVVGDEESEGGVSRTSRVVPFMLDVKAQGEILPPKRYKGKQRMVE